MFWTIDEKTEYINNAVTNALKENRDIREAIKKALEEIAKLEKGSGWSGI